MGRVKRKEGKGEEEGRKERGVQGRVKKKEGKGEEEEKEEKGW